ncbi:Complement C3 [Triplophysa tibetana]|uniref:Complement C3 n=1 Tax=Triplophysa tibetana TaxID=1572043 RepID=A0A5A9PJH3_9TELE|nr:Complement C3 [Triplophysa tibetana]
MVTRFTNTPQKNFTADFEVKEYVLPTFEVTLTPSKSFFYVDDELLTVDITAKYLFGKKIEGQAFVVFGVMDGESKTSIAASLQRVPISEGKGSADLTRDMITQTFPNILQLVGKSLFVSVSVLTETGSEMVEAQKRGLQIVTSPYTLHFKRTPQFFKPGMPFDVLVYVTNPDQTPAKNVQVEVNPGGVKGQTKANGIAKVTVNSQGGSPSLQITAKTSDPQLQIEQQAVKTMTAQAYVPKSNSQNYLHVSIDAAELEIGDQVKINLNTGKSPGAKDQDYTYMIISRGQILMVDRFKRKGQALVSLSLPVTKDMVPSFRFLAYYHVGSNEVVSDSVWVDVKDTCMGTLSLEVKNKADSYSPGKEFGLKISGDPGAKVGLVVVDKAVHVLNKNRLTQLKIWDVIEKHDIGCTAGSGRDSMGVFYDSGLMFESSTAGGTKTRTSTLCFSTLKTLPECPAPPQRRRRADTVMQVTTRLADKYSGDLKKCCIDGMRENKLGYTCKRRATYIEDGQECVAAFLDCCNVMTSNRDQADREAEMVLARTGIAWIVPGAHYHSPEATAYAVLALLKAKEYDTAGEAVRWLARQQSHYGGYDTTQATIMVFQAVAEYRTKVRKERNFNLDVEVSVSGRNKPVRWTVRKDNVHVTRSDKLVTGIDRSIQKFEMNKELSERGSLIFYVNKVSHKERDRIAFRMHKVTKVGSLQPAAVTVYEYYSPDARCTKYYHPDKEDGTLTRLCHGDVCQCAEGTVTQKHFRIYCIMNCFKFLLYIIHLDAENCSLQKKTKVSEDVRSDKACEARMDYVYKVKVVDMKLTKHSDTYNMSVEQVLKEGTDAAVEGMIREFLAHPNCRTALGIEKDKTYLIMGKSTDLPILEARLQYILGEQTWIEYWPTREESQTQEHRERYTGLSTLEKKLLKEGCST